MAPLRAPSLSSWMAAAATTFGCYFSTPEAPGDADGEAEVPVPTLAHCGDKLLQDDEECDDGNRFDGDECAWDCRRGAGASPAVPAGEARPYVAEAPPVRVEEIGQLVDLNGRLPLVWTGSVYALAPTLVVGGSYESQGLELRRFAPDGTPLGRTAVAHGDHQIQGASLRWTGDRLALFWAMPDEGIRLQHFDEEGTPLDAAVVVVDGPNAALPSADVTSDGYALAWYDNPPGYPTVSTCGDGVGQVHVRRVGRDGRTTGFPGPLTLDADAGSWPSLSAGADGLGVGFARKRPLDAYRDECVYRFVRIASDLSVVVPTGDLDLTDHGLLAALPGGGWLAAWPHIDVYAPWGDPQPACTAPFAANGAMAGPPACRPLGAGWVVGIDFAVGDRGAALLARGGNVGFLRLDERGTPVGDWLRPDPLPTESCWMLGLAWAGDAFAAVYAASLGDEPQALWFQRFVPASP